MQRKNAGGRGPPPGQDAVVRAIVAAAKLAADGDLGGAIAALESGTDGVLSHPVGCNVLGTFYAQNGQPSEALQSFDVAIAMVPAFPDAHCNRGVALQTLGRLNEALVAYDAALKYAPNHATAHFNRGNALKLLKRMDDALAAFDRALMLQPNLGEARLNRGHLKFDRGQFAEALADFDAALATMPDHAKAKTGRISTLARLCRYEDALSACADVLEGDPLNVEVSVIRAGALIALERHDEALTTTDRLIAAGDANAKAYTVRCTALWKLGRCAEALAAAAEAIRLDPSDGSAREGFAYYYLAAGDFERGWEEYEYRLERMDKRQRRVERAAAKWAGEDIAGKRLLVLGEQGIGDTIQFVRYLKPLQEEGARLTAVVQPALKRLLSSFRAPVEWTDSVVAPETFDRHVPLLSLPRLFKTRLDTVPRKVPYLFADAERRAAWRQKIGINGFKVGIAWQGNPRKVNDRERSIALAHFAPLGAVPGVRLISVQAVNGLDQLARLPPGMAVESLDTLADNPDGVFEIAAVVAGLDLVVSCDTMTAHLAGALGRPVWVALPREADWRWLLRRSDSPWYPTMRLFRQKTAGDWPAVFAEMAEALAALVAGRAALD